MTHNAITIADKLIKLGLCPIALKSPDDPEEQAKPVSQRGKRPILFDWNTRPCPRSVADMPELKPEHNIGIRTGYVEGARIHIVVLDEDSEAAHCFCEQTFAPTSMITETGRVSAGWRGRHRFYRRPNVDKCPNRAIKVLWKNPFNDEQPEVLALDVRGDGGQVVAPGSLHGTGGHYEEMVPWTEELLRNLPVLPLELLERSIADVKTSSKATEDKFPQKLRIRRFRAYLEKCLPSKPQMPPAGAGTHCLGIARAGVWGLDLPPDVVAKEMHESQWNKKCTFDDGSSYPWSIEELRHKCRDAARSETTSGEMEKRRGWMLEEPEKAAEKHIVELTAQVAQTATEVLQALADARDGLGSPLVYSQGEHLVTVHPTGTHWLDRHALSIAMDKAAVFQVHKEKKVRGEDETEIVIEVKKPPMDIADKLLSMGFWPELPVLRRVSKLPPVTLAGCLGLRPGYDLHSQTYYLGSSLEIPERPSRDEAIEAAHRLLRYVRALKFAGPSDKAKWLAYLLTLATRTAYDKCPMFLVSAVEQGCLTGDTLINTNRLGKNPTGLARVMRLDRLVYMSNGGKTANGRRWGRETITRLRSMFEDGTTRLNPMVRAFATGEKPVFRLTTESGRSIEATANHRFMLATGEWRQLSQLTVGDCVLTERSSKSEKKSVKPKRRDTYVRGLAVHPFANCKQRQVLKHRLVYEAHLSGVEYAAFIAGIRAGQTEGFIFLDPAQFVVHHLDGNFQNNNIANLGVLSPGEHSKTHYAESVANLAVRPLPDRVVRIEYRGIKPTYDVTMTDPHNSYVANGFVVHNSGKSSAIIVGYKLLYPGDLVPADYKEGDDSEWAKSLYGWSQMPLVLWDNIPDGRCVRHPKLAMILTSGKGTARELGKNRELQADFTNCVFALTGNKVTLDFDLSCRATVINLLGKPDRDPTFSPEGNRHFDAIRPKALADVYTIIRAWALAGCPPVHCTPHDRFGEWSQVVQQLVLWLGFADPVTDNDAMNADKEYLRQFHFEVHAIFGEKVWRTGELFDKAHNGMRAAIEAVSAAAELCRRRRAESAIILGQHLKVLADRPSDDFKLVNRGVLDGYQRYQMQRYASSGISLVSENTSNVESLFQDDIDDPLKGKAKGTQKKA